MKGILKKTEQGWVVEYSSPEEYRQPIHSIPLCKNDVLLVEDNKHFPQHLQYEVEFEILITSNGAMSYTEGYHEQAYAVLTHKPEVESNDLLKLAEDYAHNYFEMQNNHYQGLLKGFIAGYKQAQEKLYTKEQVRESIKQTINYCDGFYGGRTFDMTCKIIKSLKQKP